MAIKINGSTVISDAQAITSTSTISATGNVTGGNIVTTGTITATTVVGNVQSSGPVSTTGTVTGGNLATGGTISATGNITGSYILGNGSQLTGIDATSIQSGTSNVKVTSSGGNVSVSVGGTPNVAVFATTGEYVTGVVSANGNVTGGNLVTGGLVSATGNVTGNYLLGNAYFVTGLSPTNIYNGTSNVTVTSSGGNVSVSVGGTPNVAVFATTGEYVTGLLSVSGNITGGNISATNHTGTNISVTGTQTAASTVGGVITGTSTSVTGTQTAASTVGGVITGTSTSVTGNVTGANLVVTTNIYDDSVMTLITGAGNINLQPAGNVVINSKNINGLAQPVQNQDAATKLYVDNAVSTSISYHQPVVAATTTTLATTTGGTITYTQPNGVANGVGALLTTTGSFNLIDTANVQTVGTRILIKNEGNAVFNGVYTWANATNIVRSSDADTYGAGNTVALSINDYFFVSSGNVNVGSAYIVSSPTGTITFGTSNIAFSQFSQSQIFTANTQAGQLLSGTVFSTKVDGTTTAFDGGGNISVKASATLTTPNIGAATGTSLSLTGAVTGTAHNGTSVSVSGGVTAASVAGGVITGSSVSVTGAVSGASVALSGASTAASYSATGGVTAASVAGGVITGTSVSVSGSVTGGAHNGTSVSVSGGVTAASVAGGVITGSSASVTGAVTAASTVGGVITGSSISVTGSSTAASYTTAGALTVNSSNGVTAIINGGTNGGGNIGASGATFNTVFAKATTAQYADLAEKYTADAAYAPGTVVVFGGNQEVTVNAVDSDTKVAGVVSTDPGFIMNEGLDAEFVAAVALTGRVPCFVIGPVCKGDMMVAAGLGRARAEADPRVGSVIGKALEDFDGAEGTIEVVVGRF